MKVLLAHREQIDFPTAITGEVAQSMALGATLLILKDAGGKQVAAFRFELVMGYWMDPTPTAAAAPETAELGTLKLQTSEASRRSRKAKGESA